MPVHCGVKQKRQKKGFNGLNCIFWDRPINQTQYYVLNREQSRSDVEQRSPARTNDGELPRHGQVNHSRPQATLGALDVPYGASIDD